MKYLSEKVPRYGFQNKRPRQEDVFKRNRLPRHRASPSLPGMAAGETPRKAYGTTGNAQDYGCVSIMWRWRRQIAVFFSFYAAGAKFSIARLCFLTKAVSDCIFVPGKSLPRGLAMLLRLAQVPCGDTRQTEGTSCCTQNHSSNARQENKIKAND